MLTKAWQSISLIYIFFYYRGRDLAGDLGRAGGIKFVRVVEGTVKLENSD